MGYDWDAGFGIPDQYGVGGEDGHQDSVPVGRHPQGRFSSHLREPEEARPSDWVIHDQRR